MQLEAGCFKKGIFTRKAWARAVGLPLYLWGNEIFKRLSDTCGGVVAVNKDTPPAMGKDFC